MTTERERHYRTMTMEIIASNVGALGEIADCLNFLKPERRTDAVRHTVVWPAVRRPTTLPLSRSSVSLILASAS